MNTNQQVVFTLDDITGLAGMILAREPDAIISSRLQVLLRKFFDGSGFVRLQG